MADGSSALERSFASDRYLSRPYRPGTPQGTCLVWLLLFSLGFVVGGLFLLIFGYAFDEGSADADSNSDSDKYGNKRELRGWFPGTDPTYYVMRHAGVGCLIMGFWFTLIMGAYCAKEKEALCNPQY